MKNLGDITKIKGNAVEIVDVVTGGSPCQDLSVAGKRAGLAGERSGLFMEQIRIIKEMRNESRKRLHDAGADYDRTDVKPRYMVWENVAGAFSSNRGEDFRAVLEETAKVADKDAYVPGLEGGKWSPCGCILGNGWSIAWRLHDAQYWGVPQRRKRICLLADFNGDTAGKVLFELQRETTNRDTEQAIMDPGKEPGPEVQSVSKGLSGDIAQSGKEGQRTAKDTERCAGEASYTLKIRGGADTYRKPDGSIGTAGKGALVQTELSGTLGVSQDQTLIAFEPGAMSRVGGHAYEDVAGTVRANAGDNQQAVVYGIGSYDSNAMKSDNPKSGIYKADTSRTLDLNGGNPSCNQGGMAVVQGFDAYNQASTGDVAMPLRNKAADSDHIPVVCIEGNGQRESHKGDGYKESDTMYTLNTVKQHAVAYRGDAITSPINASNPKPGDPCHTLTNDSRNYVVEQHAVCVEGVDVYNMQSTGDVGRTLTTPSGGLNEHIPVIIENHPADSRVKIAEDGICQTLSGRMGTGGGNVPMVVEQLITASKASYFMKQHDDGVAETLVATDYKDPQLVAYGLDRASYNQGQNAKFDFSIEEEKIGPKTAVGPGAVCQPETYQKITETVCARISAGTSNQLASDDMFVANTSIVRRLTPLECERLQGFPDGWVDIGEWVDSKGKVRKDSDANKYKALGNSIALPFWEWMAKRMAAYLPEGATMASLFSGIGGFELVFSRAGCKPVWASEIEEFPIAVTKKRFGEE